MWGGSLKRCAPKLLAVGVLLGTSHPYLADEPSSVPGRDARIVPKGSGELGKSVESLTAPDNQSVIDDKHVRPAAQEEARAEQPEQPARGRAEADFGDPSRAREDLTPERKEIARGAPADVVSEGEAKTRATTDLGSFLGKSLGSVGVEIQKRAPLANEPRIRGYRLGQIQTAVDGAMWFPAREDLDTMLSKIDSGIIHNIIVLKGPYSAHYGPGLSFIDVETNSVLPSFTNEGQNGLWGRGRTTLNYQTQGQAWYGRQSFWGGSSDWGFRFSYGNRTGNDYDSGDNLQIPASYHAQDFDTAFGMDLSQDSHIELGYRRLDQTDTEYPGEVFDINFLVTDGYNMRYTLENQAYFDRLVVETWYNRTRFEGDAQGHGKRRQIPELDLINFIGFTDVDEMSTGFRLATTWGGEEGCSALTMGVDLRYQNQELNEFDALDIPTRPPGLSNFAIPRSHSSDPGVFLEGSLPLNDCWVIKAGSRIDWVANDIDDTPDGRTRAEMADILGTDEFDQQFTLWAAYITSEYKLDQHWSSVAAFGTAERSPTLTQLYALDPFLALLQQGITQVRGNPDLHAERAYQIDFGLRADYQRFRGGVGAFYSWINDFITYEAQEDLRSSGVPNALGVQFVNTDWATLSGAEMYGEYDWNDWLTPFASMSYVEGRDHTRGNRGIIAGASEEPLPSISPLQTRVGFRYHQPCENPRWAIEFSARIVDNQDRVASSLLEQPTGGFTTYDLRAFWKAVDSEQTGLLLVAGIENLTDKNYREHLDLRTGRGVFQPGINFYFGVELTY